MTKPLPREICINIQGTMRQQPVLFKWAPAFCGKCNVVGHNCDKMKPKGPTRKVWRPKEVQPKPQSAPQQQPQAPAEVQPQQQQEEEASAVVTPSQQEQQSNQGQDQNKLAIVPATPDPEGWQTVMRSSRRPSILTRSRGMGGGITVPFSNPFMALIEEGEKEGEDVEEEGGEKHPPSGDFYLT